MNRLVIIGNGFDLAHGLPTSYKDFIDWFWSNLINTYEDPGIKKLIQIDPMYYRLLTINPICNFSDFKMNLKDYSYEYGYWYDPEAVHLMDLANKREVFKFNSLFFQLLNTKYADGNWVDIENEYYSALKEISKKPLIKSPKTRGLTEADQKATNLQNVEILNEEFDQLKSCFQQYLVENIENKYDFINAPVNANEITRFLDIEAKIKSLVDKGMVNWKGPSNLAEKNKILIRSARSRASKSIDCILNFNYTSSVNSYFNNHSKDMNNGKAKQFQLHGTATENIVFGFGDEMDREYRDIENLDQNEYLKNFKSFAYSLSPDYHWILRFLDHDEFHVIIMGHSCGLSDRTMLNTIFEHGNCRSIQVFYHKREDDTDNFTEMVQNISRHFNDKKLMRSLVLDKTQCYPLPQTARFKLKEADNPDSNGN